MAGRRTLCQSREDTAATAGERGGAEPITYPGRRDALLWQQAIAAALGDEDFGVGRVALDLAAQTVDVGFEGVRCDAFIVAPDFAEQRVATDRRSGVVQEFEDRRFLFGQ